MLYFAILMLHKKGRGEPPKRAAKAPASPARLQGEQGLDPVIGALAEAGGLKQLLALIFLALVFGGFSSFRWDLSFL